MTVIFTVTCEKLYPHLSYWTAKLTGVIPTELVLSATDPSEQAAILAVLAMYCDETFEINKVAHIITDQDAKEILESALDPLPWAESFNFKQWLHYTGRDLLADLNLRKVQIDET